MLRPWQNPLEARKPWEVFHRQLRRWRDFRKWQNDNRGLEEDDGGFPSYVERTKLEERKVYTEHGYAKWLAEVEADPSSLKWAWELEQAQRQRQRYFCREHGCDGFPDYVEAVKRRLAQHNFTRPFQLHEDPTQQDKLTTWIEYLNFECWWLDRYTRTIQRLKPDHDKAWQDLVDLKVLRPGETNESIRTDASAMRREAEKEQAKKAVQRAKSEALRVYTLTQKEPGRSRFSRSKRMSMIDDATATLFSAKDRLESLKRRYNLIVNFIRGTFGYTGAKRDAARHTILLQWVLEQAPLIEAEMTKRETDKTGPDGATRKRKKRLATDEDHSEKRSLKKQKLEHREFASTSGSSTDVLAEAREMRTEPNFEIDQNEAHGSQTETRLAKHAVQSVGTSRTMSPGPRRSARLAAYRNTPAMALAPQTSRPGSLSRSHAKLGGLTMPLSSAEDTKPSTATKRGLKSRGRLGASKPKGVSKKNRPKRRKGG